MGMPGVAVTAGVDYQRQWTEFKEMYNKTYGSSIEEQQRFQIFKVNVDYIHKMNSMNHSFELGVTRFADRTADEFGSSHFGIAKPAELWGLFPKLGTHEYN